MTAKGVEDLAFNYWERSVHPGLSFTESSRCRIKHCSRNTWIAMNRLTNRQHGIRPRRPYFGAVLTPLHRRERVRWCNRLRGWTFRNWRRIWFSDEYRFLLQKLFTGDDGQNCYIFRTDHTTNMRAREAQ